MYLQAAKEEAEPDVLSDSSRHQAERETAKWKKVNLLGYGDKECLHCKSELQAQGRQGRSRQAVPILSRVTAFCEVCSFWDDGKKEQNIVQWMGHMAVGRGAQLSSFSTASSGQVIFS